MSKNLGVQPYLFPMPTYMIGTYNEDDTVDVMMMAWGGICAEDMVALNLEAEHNTVANLESKKLSHWPYRAQIRYGNLIFLESPVPTRWQTNLSAPGFTLSKANG